MSDVRYRRSDRFANGGHRRSASLRSHAANSVMNLGHYCLREPATMPEHMPPGGGLWHSSSHPLDQEYSQHLNCSAENGKTGSHAAARQPDRGGSRSKPTQPRKRPERRSHRRNTDGPLAEQSGEQERRVDARRQGDESPRRRKRHPAGQPAGTYYEAAKRQDRRPQDRDRPRAVDFHGRHQITVQGVDHAAADATGRAREVEESPDDAARIEGATEDDQVARTGGGHDAEDDEREKRRGADGGAGNQVRDGGSPRRGRSRSHRRSWSAGFGTPLR